MSEYQYYEFLAIDRQLTSEEMDKLRSLSTRAAITPTCFRNFYNWGDFRGNPRKMMEKYFDAFVHITNWGTRWFMLRFPKESFDIENALLYCGGEYVSIETSGNYVLLDINLDYEPEYDDNDGESWMSSLIPIRNDLMNGDYRCLYLIWLASVQMQILDDNEIEPPPPPGIRKLNSSLKTLVEFLELDSEIIEIAGERSPELIESQYSRKELSEWIMRIPEPEKDKFLLEFLTNEYPQVRRRILKEFQKNQEADKAAKTEIEQQERRTVAELLHATERLTEENKRKAAEKRAKARERKALETAIAREKYLAGLSLRKAETWEEIKRLIGKKQSKSYSEAIKLLKDIRDVAIRFDQEEDFNKRYLELRRVHQTKPKLMQMLRSAELKLL
ncbi:MAG: hypothetical protein P9L92_13320 [Candidatus Electryonea clarkiae]|nr:hypothetical protein [Candidatus Electryonea clarkiae]MDP8286782.1 hypothetical protein [Candidatus Electryonea clarkiae]